MIRLCPGRLRMYSRIPNSVHLSQGTFLNMSKDIEVNFFPVLNLLKGRYLIIKKCSFYLLSQSVLKLYAFKNFRIDNLMTSNEFLT